jgi:hypothetical protein
MTSYQDRFAARVRAAAGDATDRAIAAAPPSASLDDLLGETLHAATAAAADVWLDAMLYGDHPPPTAETVAGWLDSYLHRDDPPGPSRAGAIAVAGGLLVNPADYRTAP